MAEFDHMVTLLTNTGTCNTTVGRPKRPQFVRAHLHSAVHIHATELFLTHTRTFKMLQMQLLLFELNYVSRLNFLHTFHTSHSLKTPPCGRRSRTGRT